MTDIKIMERIGEIVEKHPKTVVGIILLITVLNIFPLMNLEMESDFSVFAPDHEVIKAEDTIDADFPDPVQRVYTIVVAKDGNILSQECLLEMLEIENNIRVDKDVQTFLIENPNNVTSIADAIDQTLLFFGTTLESASESQLHDAIDQILQIPELKAMLSKDLKTENDDRRAKAAIIVTQLNNTLLGPENEEGQLAVKDAILRTDLKETKIGVLAGSEEEIEEGMTDGLKLLPISFVLIVIVLYLSLRRGSDVLLSILGIPIIFIWMFGICSAIGLKMTMISFFTPILILALGIDYAIHSLHRYQEERKKDVVPKAAAKLSITYVGGAIFLATVTTAAAFFSNILSSIPAIRDFGIVLGIGIISAFVIMGIFLPALRLLFDARVYRRKEVKEKNDEKMGVKERGELKQDKNHPLSRAILKINRKPLLVILIVLVLTIISLLGSLQVGTEFSPKDFIPEDSEALAAMDLMVEYFPQSGTETAEILVEGEVSNPEVLSALEQTVENMKDDKHVSNIGGEPQVAYICPYIREVMENLTLIGELNIKDEDEDLIPDSKDDVVKVYDFLYENGISNATTIDIQHVLHRDSEGNYDKTLMWIDVVDYEEMGNMKEIKDELEKDSLPLEVLENKGVINSVVTGEPLVRYTVMTAMTDSMLSSIAICFIICFIVLLLVFKSFRFGVVTMIPVCLVAIWVLGTMFALGYSFNIITILIVAITIGVGVDYSIHITHRYREERIKGKKPEEAVEKALSSTGMALFGAAATTSLGFSVLVFASMKAFAAFGILTALMVVYSFGAAVIVLPVLLMLIDRKRKKE